MAAVAGIVRVEEDDAHLVEGVLDGGQRCRLWVRRSALDVLDGDLRNAGGLRQVGLAPLEKGASGAYLSGGDQAAAPFILYTQ